MENQLRRKNLSIIIRYRMIAFLISGMMKNATQQQLSFFIENLVKPNGAVHLFILSDGDFDHSIFNMNYVKICKTVNCEALDEITKSMQQKWNTNSGFLASNALYNDNGYISRRLTRQYALVVLAAEMLLNYEHEQSIKYEMVARARLDGINYVNPLIIGPVVEDGKERLGKIFSVDSRFVTDLNWWTRDFFFFGTHDIILLDIIPKIQHNYGTWKLDSSIRNALSAKGHPDHTFAPEIQIALIMQEIFETKRAVPIEIPVTTLNRIGKDYIFEIGKS
jgi:hypothetical protein